MRIRTPGVFFMPEVTASGRVVAPLAAGVIATLPAAQLPAGFYDITTHCSVSGNAAADTDNMQLMTNETLAAPAGVTAQAQQGVGGQLAAATYYYKVTAYNAQGETVGSAEVNAVVAVNGSVYLTWNAVPNATGYRVYRGTGAGAENVFFNIGAVTSWTDWGGAGTAGAVPGTNTTNTIANPVPSGINGVDTTFVVHGRYLDGAAALNVNAIGAGTAAIVYEASIEANRVG